MFRSLLIVATFSQLSATVLNAQPVAAQPVSAWAPSETRMITGDMTCAVQVDFSDGTRLQLLSGVLSETLVVRLWNGDWVSLRSLRERTMPAIFQFGGLDRTWSGTFNVQTRLRLPALEFQIRDTEAAGFLDLLGAASSLAVTGGSAAIGNYQMSGSGAAVAQIRRCAAAFRTDLDRQQANDTFRQ